MIFKRAPVPFLGKPREKHAIIQEDKSLDKKEDSKPKMLNKAQSAIDINSKKEEPTKNVNESSNKSSHHKNEIYSYLLEELNELETIIQSAKSELLNYNSNPSKSN